MITSGLSAATVGTPDSFTELFAEGEMPAVCFFQNCVVCLKRGATVSCNQKIGLTKIGCPNNFHFNCAIAHGCVFFKDKVNRTRSVTIAHGEKIDLRQNLGKSKPCHTLRLLVCEM